MLDILNPEYYCYCQHAQQLCMCIHGTSFQIFLFSRDAGVLPSSSPLPAVSHSTVKKKKNYAIICNQIIITRIPANTKITSKAFWVPILHCVLWIILLKWISKSTELNHWWNTEYCSLQISEVLLSHLCVPVCFNL